MAETEAAKSFKFPTAYTILFALIVVVGVATGVIPGGGYDVNEEGGPKTGADQRHVRHRG